MAYKKPIRTAVYVQAYPMHRTRIRIPQPPVRPVNIHQDSLIKKELLTKDPWWMTIHRRGIKRPAYGEDPLEARAVPKDQVKGTLPERIVFKYLTNVLKLVNGIDFDFQSCMKSDHKVLTANLEWVEVGTLKPGDKVVSFDEEGPKRKYKTGTVVANSLATAELFEVKFTNGESVFTTKEHPWLVYGDARKPYHLIKGGTPVWFLTEDLKPGIQVPKFLIPSSPIKTWDSGYLAGFFDSEGSLIQTSQSAHDGTYTTITAAQNKGPTLDLMIKLVKDLGFNFSIYDYDGKYKRSYDDLARKSVAVRIRGGMAESIRFLSSIRPPRLLNKFNVDKMGTLKNTYDRLTIESITPAGQGEIAKLEIDTHTYIGEGFAMHNSQSGGRMELGGLVADFLFFYMKMVIQVQGSTHSDYLRMKKDEEQRGILENMGYRVFDIEESTCYSEPQLEEWMRRVFGLALGAGNAGVFIKSPGMSGGSASYSDPEQQMGSHEAEYEDQILLQSILNGIIKIRDSIYANI